MKTSVLALFVYALTAWSSAFDQATDHVADATSISFSKDIAPILFDRCAKCHHSGGPAPFSVLDYAVVRQHAAQIADATKRRYMPPWKADPADGGGFVGQKPLTDAEIALIQRWVGQGASEGNPRDLPERPKIAGGWELGTPDLVVSTAKYMLQADGTDVFRIFVVALPADGVKYVRGMEFHPSSKVVHHANIRIDTTPASRLKDQADPKPGYSGLILRSAVYPDGHFLGWTPGQVPPLLPKGLAWQLNPGTDLVVELHMQPSGKPEEVQATIGFFFGPDPPDRIPAMLRLGRQNIDIPPGDKDYVVSDSFVLPVDAEVQAVQPHAHYRAREVSGTATLPDGTIKPLITIKDWDFRWQHVFRYVSPFWLPKGTTLSMRYTYDNSETNPRLPEHPPQRVRWGQRSADEMGDLWIQVLTRTAGDLEALTSAFRPKVAAEDAIGHEVVLQSDPDDAALHDDLALLYLELDKPDRAVTQFRESVRIMQSSPAAHFNLGTALTVDGQLDEAAKEFRAALQLKPDYGSAHNNLGSVLLQRGNIDAALAEFVEAVRLEPNSPEVHYNLGRAYRTIGDYTLAVANIRRAVQLRPEFAAALADLSWLLAAAPDDSLRDSDQAVRFAERVVDLTGRRNPAAFDVLAAALAEAGDFERALTATEEALRLAPQEPMAAAIRQRQELYRQHKAFRILR